MSTNKNVRSITLIGLSVMALVLAYLAGRNSALSVQADSVKYSFLAIQPGSATAQGGKHVADLRNGNMWVCNYASCNLEGRMPFEKITETAH